MLTKSGWFAIPAALTLFTATISHGRSIPGHEATQLNVRSVDAEKPSTIDASADSISNRIYAVLEDPKPFKEDSWVKLGSDNSKPALVVFWDTEKKSRLTAAGGLPRGGWDSFSTSGAGYPQFTQWRLIPTTNGSTAHLTAAEENTDSNEAPLDKQFYLVNEYAGAERDGTNPTATKWGLSSSNRADGTSAMANLLSKDNLSYLRRVTVSPSALGSDWGTLDFIPASVNNTSPVPPAHELPGAVINFNIPPAKETGPTIGPTALFEEYTGLTTKDLIQTPAYASAEKVYTNVCAMRKAAGFQVINPQLMGQLKVRAPYYYVLLSKGAPMPQLSRVRVPYHGERETLRPHGARPGEWNPHPRMEKWYICSPATLQVKLSPPSV
ncbi:hypothetical protein TWF696_001002 [Orbilia brochopaga]|uniref:Uncharacterized protein n=1 Tax=Orbilia brochopaga TaxID=3140254 RepID=A0AAV9VDJ1_9PEZI